ncbi:MAG TPA: class I SAM-dependent methyltransferase [Polyangia bacterium]|nr:class I SAM-dependent methyltransferase [Polyangia bacterium]
MDAFGQVRDRLRATLSVIGRWPPLVPVLFNQRVQAVLRKLPGSSSLYGEGWSRVHPFDRLNGTDTSGFLLVSQMRAASDHPALAHASMYGGSQPSFVRAALDVIPDVGASTFVDLGCGKGRALLVAAERPFRAVVGVELAADLARVARANAAIMAARHPERPPVRVETADAATYELPAGNVVLFLYDPFGAELMGRVVESVERAIQSERRAVYVIYYNPVSGHLFDASPLLRRRWARMLPCAREERGYGAELDDAIVVWQGGTAPPPPEPVNMAPIRLIPGRRAELVGD